MSLKLISLALLLSVFSAGATLGAEYDDIDLVSQTSSDIVFRYRSGPLGWTSDADGVYPDLGRTALNKTPGYPVIPGRIVYVAVPPGTRTVIADLLASGAIATGSHPSLRPSDGTTTAYPYPPSLVEVDRVFTLRGLTIARLILHPLSVLDASGRYRLTGDMTVRLRFPSPGTFQASAPSPLTPGEAVFGRIYSSLLLNPGMTGRWRSDDVRGGPGQAAPLGKPAADPNPFAGSDDWVAVHVAGGGIVRLEASRLADAGVDLSGVDPSRLRLFSGPARALSLLISAPPPDLTEVAVTVIGGADQSFDAGDAIEFYAVPLNRTERNPEGGLIDINNRYERTNVYWLAFDGDFAGEPRRIATVSKTADALTGTPVFATEYRVRREEENIFRLNTLGYIDSYYTWYAQNQAQDRLTFLFVRHAEPGADAVLEIGSYLRSPQVSIDGVALELLPSRPDGEDRTRIARYRLPSFDPGQPVDIAFDPSPLGAYLDYYSVEYQRRLTLASGPFNFEPPARDELFTMVLTDGSLPEVWDITDPYTPVRLTGLNTSGNAVRFDADQRDGSRHLFHVHEATRFRQPERLRRVGRNPLYTPASGADYIVIGPRSFESAVADFMSYRAGTDGLSMRFVAVEDIYDGFSLGLLDPVAIRRFLRYARWSWPSPAPVYVLLVGDGSHDFLGNSGLPSVNYVPPYVVPGDRTVSDENYIYFGDRLVLGSQISEDDDPVPDMLIGRWPVKTAADIRNITAKIKGYESNDNLGPWRSRVVLVADDEFGDRSGPTPSVVEMFHVRDSEGIAKFYIPRRMDLNKIYMTEFPFDNPDCTKPSARGCRKPGVNQAILDALNEGVAIFDYLGHGNRDLMAHERVFQRTVELPQLTNDGMPTAVLTFSCSIGFFDHPASEGMSEEWLRMPGAGAVAVISATRLVTASANAALNEKVFDLLLNENMLGIGASLYTGKFLRQYFHSCTICPETLCPCENDRKYVLFGDPAMKLGIPVNRIRFESVQPETLSALARMRITGSVIDTNGNSLAGFDGTAAVIVRDAPRERIYRINETRSLEYELAGGTLYRGEIAVTGGRFDFGFVVPKDIAYGRRGAQVLVHASSTDQMAAGVLDSLWIAGSSGAPTDTSGPVVQWRTAASEPIADGFRLPLGTEIVIALSDPSGINLTGSPGHRLEITLDDNAEALVDLTEVFAYAPGSYERGEARFIIADVPTGRHVLALKAWDNANNSTLLEADVEITAAGSVTPFEVREFLNYPNPFADSTVFYFSATRSPREARIRIFTLTGRLIWETEGAVDGLAGWNGADLDGDPVGNGVYLAQIEVTGEVDLGGQLVEKTAYRETKVVLSR